MFRQSKSVVLASLVTACLGMMVPTVAMARGGGGHGGFGGGGFHGGFHGGGFHGGGFRGGGFSGFRSSGIRSGGFGGSGLYGGGLSRGSENYGSTLGGERLGGEALGGERLGGEMGNAVSGFRGTEGTSFGHVPEAPSGRWNHFGRGGRFNRFRRGFFGYGFFPGFFGDYYWGLFNPWWYGAYPWWYPEEEYYDFWNPYYTAAYLYGGYNYAAPIQVNPEEPQDDAAFAAARQEFYAGNYTQALLDIDEAVQDLPGNPDVHAFQGLIFFALGYYQQAAAVAHTVLGAGPGWDWAILQSFYPSADVYTKQLRALEHYVGAHPNDPAARFLLAYQYLMLGHIQAAGRQLEKVVALEPRDKLSADILAAIERGPAAKTPAPPKTEPGTTAVKPAPPMSIKQLTGTWKATPVPGVTIQTTLDPDGHFTWTTTQGGQTQSFNGTYTLQNENLVFTRTDGNTMDGIVTPERNGFQFRLKNAPPELPGLQFSK
jgi:hypothetical protein